MPQFGDYPSVVTLNLSDTMLVLQTGSVKQASLDDLETLIGDSSRWVVVESSKYTSTPASDTSITMSDTGNMKAGLPIRVTQGGVLYYLIVSSVTTNTSIAVNGPALGGTAITQLEVGKAEQVIDMQFFVSSTYANGTTTTLLLTDMNQAFRWRMGKAYMVQASFHHKTADSTSGPRVQARIAGAGVIADNTLTGVTVTSAATWYDSVNVQSAYYDIDRGDAIEIQIATAGGTGNCANLSAVMTFILE